MVRSVKNSEAGEVIVGTEDFWAHFGAEDAMAALQHQIAERLAEEGLDVAFEVLVSLLPEPLP